MKKLSKKVSVILGVNVSKLPMDMVLERIESFLASDKTHKIFTPNPEICFQASKDTKYAKILNSSSLNVADGFGLKIGGSILGQKVPHRITGVNLTWEILKMANKKPYKIMLLGGKPGIAKLAAEKIRAKFANIEIVGAGEGLQIKYKKGSIDYDHKKNQKVINFINQAKPDILLIAFGAPKQEFWIYENIYKIKPVKLAVGVGGTFDFIAGKTKRAPKWIRKIGFEWMYRLIQEPKRIKRIISALIIFPLTCVIWRYGWHYKYRPNVANIIYNNHNQILLIFNPRFHYWTLPQGGIEKKETIEASAKREINEELGIEGYNLKLLKILSETYSYNWPESYRVLRPYKGQKQNFALWKFTGTKEDIDFRKSDEVANIRWVAKEKLLNEMAEVRRDAVRKIFQYL